MKIIILAILVSLLESVTQYSLKSGFNPLLGILGYALVSLSLGYAYQNFKICQFNTVWSCISIISAYMMGKLLFKEKISVRGYISLGFLFVAIILSNE